jgi:phytoene dehydrogenase-like protein
MKDYDAIVIGAGHNGLTNGAYLAKAGLNVVVLERNDYIGGAAVSRELHPGWTYSNASYVCSMLRQSLHRDLDLTRHGLILVPYLGTVNFGDNGETLVSYPGESAEYLELQRHSPHDADAMHRFQADLARYAKFIRKTLLRTPPDPTSFRLRDVRELLFLGKQFWALGEKQMYEYVRFFTMSAAEFLEDYFENDLVKAAMASPGIIGTALGVYSPGSAYILLHHVMGDVDGNIGAWGLARGGMGAISKAIAGALQQHGGELRTNAGVRQVLVKNGRAAGVVLESGEELYARIVVSNLDAKGPSQKSWTGTTCRPAFTRKPRSSRSAARPARSTSRSRACPNLPAYPTIATSTGVGRASPARWKRWNGPTTAGSADAGPMTRLSNR